MFVFAGYDGHTRFNDLWKCTLKNQKFKWRQIHAEGNQPLNRFGHVAVVCHNSMFVIGGWNGHDTMDDIFQYSFRKFFLLILLASNLWLEIRRIKGVRPKPRYRHSAVAFDDTIFIFGGVDTQQQRFHDLFSYETETRKWSEIETIGHPPKERTFHKAVIFDNVMYVIGGFDGSRLNDLYHIALPGQLEGDELGQSVQKHRNSSASGEFKLSEVSGSVADDQRWNDNTFLRKKIGLLQRQVRELSSLLKQEEDTFDDCNICFTREINTVFLDCSHRVMC
jgi:leucine-zipper-like transcriptional regulator 1